MHFFSHLFCRFEHALECELSTLASPPFPSLELGGWVPDFCHMLFPNSNIQYFIMEMYYPSLFQTYRSYKDVLLKIFPCIVPREYNRRSAFILPFVLPIWRRPWGQSVNSGFKKCTKYFYNFNAIINAIISFIFHFLPEYCYLYDLQNSKFSEITIVHKTSSEKILLSIHFLAFLDCLK